MLQKIMWLALAGACGTISRYSLCELAEKAKPTPIPAGTFLVNIIGSFLFGLIYVLAQRKINISPETRVIILTGFMGAFTTFSTFAFETAKMIKDDQWILALSNILAQTIFGILALGAGVLIARTL